MLPYEHFLRNGSQALSDSELLAIILRTGTRSKSALMLADEVLDLCPGRCLLGLHHLSITELCSLDGIGEVKAIKLKSIGELARRISMESLEKDLRFDAPEIVAAYYMESMRHLEYEEVMLICLDQKLNRLSEKILSVGSVAQSILSVREVFKEAMKQNAANVMLLHNHPSGDPTPSKQDILITGHILEISKIMQIPLIDHIVIGDKAFISMKQQGIIT